MQESAGCISINCEVSFADLLPCLVTAAFPGSLYKFAKMILVFDISAFFLLGVHLDFLVSSIIFVSK